MKNTKAAVFAGMILGSLCLVSQIGAQTVAYQNSTTLPDNGLQGSGTGGPYNFGLEFTVNTPIDVTALGAYDSTIGRSGTGFGSAVQVGIFSEATSTFVSPIVTFTGIDGAIVDGSQFQSITTLTLEPGTYKVVAGGYGLDSAKAWNIYFTGDTTSPIVFDGGDGALSLGLNYFGAETSGIEDPTMADGTPAPAYAAGTFFYTVVPEPSSQTLLLAGTALLGFGMSVHRKFRG